MSGKTFFAMSITALMVLLAFTSAISINHNADRSTAGQLASNSSANAAILGNYNSSGLTVQEMQVFQQFVIYNLVNYGIHSDKLDQLQYVADLNFVNWYASNYSQIPASYRGISQQNASVILPIWEHNSPQAVSDVQAVAEYEVSQSTVQNEVNTTYVVKNHLGTLVSNTTIVNNSQSANLITYKYTKDNQSLVYSLVEQHGIYTPVDPYITLNAFTIHWGWGGLISGTSYDIYFTFTDYNNALNFKNFLVQAATIAQWATFSETIAFWIVVGIFSGPAAPIVGIVGALETLWGQGDPLTAAQNVENIFDNQEAYINQYTMVYTLNAWEWGLVPEFSWWGYMYNDPSSGQQTLTQVFKSVGFASSSETNFELTYAFLTNIYGTNIQQSFPPSSDWMSTAEYLSSLL